MNDVKIQHMETFKSNNECVEIVNTDTKISIIKGWGDESICFEYDTQDDFESLDNIVLKKELFALYHKDKQMYEFIYLPLQEKYERTFDYIFCGKKFHLSYEQPTDTFVTLAKRYRTSDSAEISDRAYALLRYNFYYKNQENEDDVQKLFPTNFFITGPFDTIPYEEHLDFFKHINFMLTYYDRKSPNILIFNNNNDSIEEVSVPCKSLKDSFPKIINGGRLDPTLLELMKAAREAGSYRLKYIFYFQVLEYCSYYYIENSLRRKITNIIKSPDILNSEKYSNKIIELYSDYFKSNKDDKRMERLIQDLCTYDDIREEIKSNESFFTKSLQFEGGFCIDPLFKNKEEIDNPPTTIFTSIRKNIDSIRNVIVHARETRENAVIKPTIRNSRLLAPYLYLLRRIAETVIIKYE